MKRRVFLSLLLVVTMILGGVSTVFAANGKVVDIISHGEAVDVKPISDIIGVDGKGFNSEKIMTLVKKGYVQGYPDGTLGLERNITRAEFATIIVNALGLQEEANSILLPITNFSDVNPTSWYARNLAVASQLGIINGYPDGTFKPENEVSYQEAFTMLVRMVLSPEEIMMVEAGGKYPYNYYQAAFNLGLLEDINVNNIAVPALRGNVFVALYNAIVYMDGEELIEPEEVTVEGLVVEKEGKEVKLLLLDEDKEVVVKTDKNLRIGEVYLLKVKGEEVVEVKESSKAKVVTGELVKDGQGIRIDRKKYSLDDVVEILFNGEEVEFKSLPRRVRTAKATLYNDKVIYLAAYDFDEIIAIDDVKNNRVYGVTEEGYLRLISDNRYTEVYLYEDGKLTEASFGDIEAGDVAHIKRDKRDTVIILTRDHVGGVVGKFDPKEFTVEIEGTAYKLAEKAVLTQDRKIAVIDSGNVLRPYEGNDAVASLNILGEIQLINVDEEALVFTKAIITGINGYVLDVVTETGRSDKFIVTEFTELFTLRRDRYESRYNRERVVSELAVGDVVKVLADAKGQLEEIEVLPAEDVVITYLDDTVIEVGNKDYYLSEGVTVFERAGRKITVADLYDYADLFYRNRNLAIAATIYEYDREVDVIIIDIVDEEAKEALLNYIESVKEKVEEYEAYFVDEDIEAAAAAVESLAQEILVNIDHLSNEDFKIMKEALAELVDELEKAIVDMLKADLELMLDDLITLREDLLAKGKFAEADEVFLMILEVESSLETKLTVEEAEMLIEDIDALLDLYEDILDDEIDDEIDNEEETEDETDDEEEGGNEETQE